MQVVGQLFTLARAHAALCWREAVSTEDCVVAIYLIEESLLAATGRSVMQFSRALAAHKCNLDMYARQPAEQLTLFEAHLARFLRAHSSSDGVREL